MTEIREKIFKSTNMKKNPFDEHDVLIEVCIYDNNDFEWRIANKCKLCFYSVPFCWTVMLCAIESTRTTFGVRDEKSFSPHLQFQLLLSPYVYTLYINANRLVYENVSPWKNINVKIIFLYPAFLTGSTL